MDYGGTSQGEAVTWYFRETLAISYTRAGPTDGRGPRGLLGPHTRYCLLPLNEWAEGAPASTRRWAWQMTGRRIIAFHVRMNAPIRRAPLRRGGPRFVRRGRHSLRKAARERGR